MEKFKAVECKYQLLYNHGVDVPVYPYLRSSDGDKEMFCVGPLHGRSYVVGRLSDGRYVVSKGNGLSYTQYSFLNTRQFGDDTLGLLLRNDAERDYRLGIEIESLGIKTNRMEYLMELDAQVSLPTGHSLKPILLQYDVECPYRICDAPFMSQELINEEVAKWEKMNHGCFNESYLIAADVLIHNLRVLHDHQILHNAIHEQNYTWALELLDFELACSPKHPYVSEADRRHAKDLFEREITQTYVIINYIAGVLRETIDFVKVDSLFEDYGFDIHQYKV